jgi:biopolymer transport protein ExbB
VKIQILFYSAALAGLIVAAGSPRAQDNETTGTPGGNAPAVSPPEDSASPANANVAPPEGIPTDPRGIAEAIGWPFSVAFILASVIAVWTFIERLVVLRRRRVIPRAFVDRFLMQLRAGRMDRADATAACQQNDSPVAVIFLHGVRKWGRPSVEVEQAVLDGGERQVAELKRGLRLLNGVATLSPLIGLLGTVIGMIQSFNEIAFASAMGKTEALASGIALALLTTAVGLLIAIPAMAAHLFLAGRIDRTVAEMDQLGQELVCLISAEALKERTIMANATGPIGTASGMAARPADAGGLSPASDVPPPPRQRKVVTES